jgi:hypothetical protein
MRELNYKMPDTVEDRYITGNYGEGLFKIPAIFNEDGILDTEASLLQIENFKIWIDNTPYYNEGN